MTDIIVDDALRRRKAFENLDRNLKEIKEKVINLDSKAEVYLFGSVARGENTLSSDIDVLILTNLDHRVSLYVGARRYASAYLPYA